MVNSVRRSSVTTRSCDSATLRPFALGSLRPCSPATCYSVTCYLASLLLCTLLPFLLLPACAPTTVTPAPPVFITAAGSTAMGPLLAELAAAYRERNSQVTIEIQGGGSEMGQQLLARGQADLGMLSWPPQKLGDGVQLFPVARDGIALIVHPDNRLEGLSMREAQEIFSGRLLNWQALDGPTMSIQVVSREEGSGTRAAFEARLMAGVPVTPAAIMLPHSRAVLEFVARNPNAIGYISWALVDETVHILSLEGIAPNLETIGADSYPLVRELALLAPVQPTPEVADFIKFALSPTGQGVVREKWGMVRQVDVSTSFEADELRN